MTQTSRYPRSRRRSSLFCRRLSTPTLIIFFLGVFVVYGGYFVINAADAPKQAPQSTRNLPAEPIPGNVQPTSEQPLHPAGHRAVQPAKTEAPPGKAGPSEVHPEAKPPEAPAPVPFLKERWWRSVHTGPQGPERRAAGAKAPPTPSGPEEIKETPEAPVPGARAPEVARTALVAPGIRKVIDENTVVVSSGPSPKNENCRTLIFDASKSSDPDNDRLSFEWDFGDGSPKSKAVRVRHTFPRPGEYTVSLTVTDNTPGKCATSTATQQITVNIPPVAVGIFPIKLKVKEVGEFDASQSHDTPGDRLSYEWDFGDGAKASGAKAFHAYEKPGEYNVILAVKDNSRVKNCDTSIVASKVIVQEEAPPRPALAIVRPKLIIPARKPEPAPVMPPPTEEETEMEGLMRQVRKHQGEPEAPPPEQVVVKPTPPPPAPRPPLQLVATTPQPERPKPPPRPKFIPDTHRYVLAWAGGYLVSSPTVNCDTETEASRQSRLERKLIHLIETVDRNREEVRKLRVLSEEQKEYQRKLDALEVELRNFQKKTRGSILAMDARVQEQLRAYEQKVLETQDQFRLLAEKAAQNARGISDLSEEVNRHIHDSSIHATRGYRRESEYTAPTRTIEERRLQRE